VFASGLTGVLGRQELQDRHQAVLKGELEENDGFGAVAEDLQMWLVCLVEAVRGGAKGKL
jgi:hypothetical protein